MLLSSKCNSTSELNNAIEDGMEVDNPVEDKSNNRRELCNVVLEKKFVREAVMACPLTTNDCRDNPLILEGKPPPKLLFFTSVRDVTFDNDVNKLSGSALNPVDSKCRVVKDVKLLKDPGSDPPGITPFPMTSKFCSPDKSPSSFGTAAGTAGNVSEMEDTKPDPPQVTPLQAQNFTSFNQPPFDNPCWPVELADANTACRPQNWIEFCTFWPSCRSVDMKLSGTAARRGKQLEHGKDEGLLGALTVNCERHCCWSLDSANEDPPDVEVPPVVDCPFPDELETKFNTRMFNAIVLPRRYRRIMIKAIIQ